MADQARAVFATRDDVPHDAARGSDTALLLTSVDTAGRSTAAEIAGEPGATIESIGADGAHRYIFVVSGEWTVTLDGEQRACAADTMIQLPAGTTASARVTGTDAGRLLVVTLPAAKGATL